MLSVLLVCLLLQDPVETNLKLLSDKDPTVREAATVELTKTPVEKLSLIEKRLGDSDADVAARARRVMTYVLNANVGLRKARFELRPLAVPSVMQDWVKAGADLKKVPNGLEAVQYREAVKRTSGYEHDWVLVEPACVCSEDIAEATVEPEMDLMRSGQPIWLVRFELKPDGAKRFDRAAEALFKREPRGPLAIILDGRIVVAPIIQSERFGGKAVIQGNYTVKEAEDVAGILKDDVNRSFLRIEKERETASAPEKILESVRALKGLERVSIKSGAGALEIAGFVTTESVDVILLWQTLRDHG